MMTSSSMDSMDLGVSKNTGTPKWMVKIMENPIKMDDLGGKPTIFRKPPFGCSPPSFSFRKDGGLCTLGR